MAHKIANGVDAHELTDEDRAKSIETRRKNREAREREAEERFIAMLNPALTRHNELLASEDEAIATKNIREVYDRTLGRPVQRTELSGDVGISVNVDELRGKLDTLLTRETEAK